MPQYIADESRNYASQGVMQPGRCANFDGIDDYVDLGSSAALSFNVLSPFSFSMWFNVSAADSDAGLFMKKSTASNALKGWGIRAYGDIGYVTFTVGDGVNYSHVGTSNGAFVGGTWVQLVCTYNGAGVTKIYINGYFVASSTWTGAFVSTASDACPAAIGALNFGGSRYHLYTGKIFDVRAYNRELTASEAFAIYDTTKGPGRNPASALFASNLVGHWKLDEGLSSMNAYAAIAYDSSVSKKHGSYVGSVSLIVDSSAPFSWQNESGFSPVSNAIYPQPTYTDLYSPKFTSWVATGAAATALTNQSYGGKTGLVAARFMNGASAGYGVNRVDGSAGYTFNTPVNRLCTMVVEAALSRPLVSSELIYLYFTGGTAGPTLVFTPSTIVDDITKFNVYHSTFMQRDAAYQQYPVCFVGSAITGGDLTVYISSMRYIDLNYPTSDPFVGIMDFYPGERMPQYSSDLTKDVWGTSLGYPGPLPRNAALIDGFCGTFDGIDDYTTAAGGVVSGQLTLSAWVYWTGTANQAVVGKWGTGSVGYMLYLGAGGKPTLFCSSTANGYAQAVDGITQNKWVHLSATWNGTSATIYVNGSPVPTTTSGSLSNPSNPPESFSIGSYAAGSGGRFGGKLVDVRLYNSALSASDVALLYSGASIVPQPVEHWPFQEGDGSTLYNVSGSGNHATLFNATLATFWGTRQPKVHRNITHGYRLSGTVRIPALNSLVNAADGGAITNPAGSWHNGSESRIDFTGGVSNAPWLSKLFNGYMTTDGAGAGYSVGAAIVGKVSSALTLYARVKSIDLAAFRCLLDLDSGATLNRAQFGISTGGVLQVYDNTNGYQSIGSSQTTKLTDGNWHDLAFVWSATSVTAYLDNVALGTVAAVNLSSISSAWTRGGVLSDAALSGLKFKGNIARLIVAGTVMSSSMFGTANLLDLRFDNDINEDAAGRLATVPLSAGHTPSKVTVPTAYNFGDTLPEGMRKSVATNRESRFALMNTDR